MSSPLSAFREALVEAVLGTFELDVKLKGDLLQQIRIPESGRGDLSLPCFHLAKQLKMSPPALATQVRDAIHRDPLWETVEAVGPYVNVHFSRRLLAEKVVPASRSETFGSSDAGHGKTVVIDFSSPNIAKPLAFHHIRSTVIGAALGRLHQAQGWKVVGINYLGDWGKQFGVLAAGFQRHGDPKQKGNAKHLVEVYIKSSQDVDVTGTTAVVERPKQAKQLLEKLRQAEQEVADCEDEKTQKKLEKTVKGLRKRVAAILDAPPEDTRWQNDATPYLAALEDRAESARENLPQVIARDQEARLFLKKMEDGEQEALAEWRGFRDASIEEFQRVYERMGVEFTHIEGESFYTGVLEETVVRARKKPGTRIDAGAEVLDIKYEKGAPPVILKTKEGTTLYVTRDIAAATDRFERFAYQRALYIVDVAQSLHFEQLFRSLEAMGYPWADRCHHVAFGRVMGMSTRRGNLVFLDEVLEEAVQKARAVCKQSGKIAPENLEEAVEAIGIGAVIFADLKGLRSNDYTFRWDDILNFNGHTAPYVQFSHARASSILKKAGSCPEDADLSRLSLPEEHELIKTLARYPDAVREACDSFEPSLVTRVLLEIAQAAAQYFTAGNKERGKRILVEDDAALRAARLHLVDGVRQTLKSGLALLGIKAPPAM